MKVDLGQAIYWVLVPFINFIFWFYVSKTHVLTGTPAGCPVAPSAQEDTLQAMLEQSLLELEAETLSQPCAANQAESWPSATQCQHRVPVDDAEYFVTLENTKEFDKYRQERLASMTMSLVVQTYTDVDTVVLNYRGRSDQRAADAPPVGDATSCLHMDHHFLDVGDSTCVAVAYVENTDISYDIARVDSDIDMYGLSLSNPDPSQIDKYSSKYQFNQHNVDKAWPTGFFRKVPKERGRIRMKEKLGTFLIHYDSMQRQLLEKLARHGIKAGDDLVVMVLNEGELDLFLNFACSCRAHDISLRNIMVFAGSSELIPVVEATGAMALYHEGYASVSKKASTDYLDRVFVDMMWYKAFSVYFVLKQGINILFQDLDLVWFREPMQYFHDYMKATGMQVEGFFSDDGQRSKRYTPFFANSGFYYLSSSDRSIYFTWSIMIAMDAIQVLGSHQNVMTTRMIEGLALNFEHVKLLSLEDFPTGIMYHHHRAFMQQLRNKEVNPYNFHMCWTQGKPDKLIYLRKAAMWYLSPECSPLEALIARDPEDQSPNPAAGAIFDFVGSLQHQSDQEQWDQLGARCCATMAGAP